MCLYCSQPNGVCPKSIKGGISICFPQVGLPHMSAFYLLVFYFDNTFLDVFCLYALQLGTSGASEKQGSSRNKLWSLDNCPLHLVPTGSPSSVDLILKPTENGTIIWPCRYIQCFGLWLGLVMKYLVCSTGKKVSEY